MDSSTSNVFSHSVTLIIIMVSTRKTCLRTVWKQHSRSLISAFVIHFLESIISTLGTKKNFNFLTASVAEQTYLSMAWTETPKWGDLFFFFIFFLCSDKLNCAFKISFKATDTRQMRSNIYAKTLLRTHLDQNVEIFYHNSDGFLMLCVQNDMNIQTLL